MTDREKTCKGCIDYEDCENETECLYVIIKKCKGIHKDIFCPCSICLIKMICVFSCERFKDYVKMFRKNLEENNMTVFEYSSSIGLEDERK